MKKIIPLFLVLSAIIVAGSTCDSDSVTIDFTPSEDGNFPVVTSDLVYENWTTVSEGVDFKQYLIKQDSASELLSIVRFDPANTKFKIAVDQADPKTLANWQTQEGAMIAINGSYFDENYKLTTRTVVDKKSFGPLLSGKTAIMRSVDGISWTMAAIEAVPDSTPLYSIQSYPLLMENGEVIFSGGSDNVAQRTVVAIDSAGMMYWIAAEYGVLSLMDLANVLDTELDISIENALNLDGGPSTGMIIESPMVSYNNSSVAVPSVLYIQAVD